MEEDEEEGSFFLSFDFVLAGGARWHRRRGHPDLVTTAAVFFLSGSSSIAVVGQERISPFAFWVGEYLLGCTYSWGFSFVEKRRTEGLEWEDGASCQLMSISCLIFHLLLPSRWNGRNKRTAHNRFSLLSLTFFSLYPPPLSSTLHRAVRHPANTPPAVTRIFFFFYCCCCCCFLTSFFGRRLVKITSPPSGVVY